MTKLEFPAKLLQDGDRLTWSSRYGNRVRGVVKLRVVSGNLVFLDSPTLDGDEVAFQANETVRVDREDKHD